MAVSTIPSTKIETLFSTFTDIKNGATLTLNRSASGFKFVVLKMVTGDSDTYLDRTMVIVPVAIIDIVTIPARSVGESGFVTLDVNDTRLRIIQTGGFTKLNLVSVQGVR